MEEGTRLKRDYRNMSAADGGTKTKSDGVSKNLFA
jgi:hypothetical protein